MSGAAPSDTTSDTATGTTTDTPVDIQTTSAVSEGEDVFLHIEAAVALATDVTVEFHVQPDSGAAGTTWEEQLKAEPTTAKDAAKKAVKIAWKVGLAKPGDTPKFQPPLSITFQAKDAKGVSANGDEKLLVRVIKVTDDTHLTRIMVHEFAKKNGSKLDFDPDPAKKFLTELSPQQRNLLLNYKLKAGVKGRNVVFMTFTKPPRHHRMGADYCGALGFREPRGAAQSNATFSMFRCEGAGKDVTLVLHTEYLVLNLERNLAMTNFMLARIKDLEKSNPAPKLFKLACGVTDSTNDDVPWVRVFDAQGNDILDRSTMHGTINTKGCWMLFRNYNWPKADFDQFEEVYRGTYRFFDKIDQKAEDEIYKKLTPLGYDKKTASASEARSLDKFTDYDRNFAYLWFMHELVGIKYWDTDKTVNEFNVAGLDKVATFPLAQGTYKPLRNLPEEGNRNAYLTPDGFAPRKDDAWRSNIFGDPPFVFARNDPGTTKHVSNIEKASWADLYFFKEDGVTIAPKTGVVS